MAKSNVDKMSKQIFKVVKIGSHFKLANTAGKIVGTQGIGTPTRKKAYEAGKALRKVVGSGGKIQYRLTEMSEFDNLAKIVINGLVNKKTTIKSIMVVKPSVKANPLTPPTANI